MAFLRDISNDESEPQWTPAASDWSARDISDTGFMWLGKVLRRRRSRVVLSGLKCRSTNFVSHLSRLARRQEKP